ncbi:K02A2.6-like [Cordylochernes scorpioides]|uniref:K02A2.6-like n=1 Tax=Cordylochernes scorpioides TaxID=51811 RepID=A0ABY6KEG7_9ARAC|nr:K02A2.6-like [Cordylochernes scorpioides]
MGLRSSLIPFPIKDKVKKELYDMEAMGIIKKVNRPNSSHMVIVRKDEKLRICLDSSDLNNILKAFGNSLLMRKHSHIQPFQHHGEIFLSTSTLFDIKTAPAIMQQILIDLLSDLKGLENQKSVFEKEQIKFLGNLISRVGIQIDPNKCYPEA